MTARRRLRLRVLVLTHQAWRPDVMDAAESDPARAALRTEIDVIGALERLGHDVRVLGGEIAATQVRHVVTAWKPHVAFNLLEEFEGEGMRVPYVLGYLDLMGVPYTGCNPRGLILADTKALMKKILRYHRVPTPDFVLVRRGRRPRGMTRLGFPVIVKSATTHGSVGIAQASVVRDEKHLAERIAFVHERIGTDALVESYVGGRELYVGVLGNRRRETFPAWELRFDNPAPGAEPIATERAKWDEDYQRRRGIHWGPAEDLDDALRRRMDRIARRTCRILELDGYARMDFRLAEDGRLVLLEPNPNPDLARDDEFATSAAAAGLAYPALVTRIVALARRRRRVP